MMEAYPQGFQVHFDMCRAEFCETDLVSCPTKGPTAFRDLNGLKSKQPFH